MVYEKKINIENRPNIGCDKTTLKNSFTLPKKI